MVSIVRDWNSISIILSCESLTLTKMGRLTITQCIKITETYYKNGDSARAKYRRPLNKDYVEHNRPTTLGIGKIVKRC